MIQRMRRAAILVILATVVVSCGGGYWALRPTRELCRYPLEFFTNQAHRTVEVSERINQDDQIRAFGLCILDDPRSSHFTARARLTSSEYSQSPITADYLVERESIQVGADTVRVWSHDRGQVYMRVDVDGWLGELDVRPDQIGIKSVPDEHLPAAAEMLVRMTRDLKGPSR
jgi:hypothetical protein